MSPRPSRLAVPAAVSVLAAVGALTAPGAQAARRHHPAAAVHRGLYDCYSYSFGGTFSYLGTYTFPSPGRYGLAGLRKGRRLIGRVDWGRYRLRGKRVTPTSGPMKRNHDYMLIKNANELLLRPDKGGGLAIGCYRYTGH